MSYDMRLWAGLQMQQYMMDSRGPGNHLSDVSYFVSIITVC